MSYKTMFVNKSTDNYNSVGFCVADPYKNILNLLYFSLPDIPWTKVVSLSFVWLQNKYTAAAFHKNFELGQSAETRVPKWCPYETPNFYHGQIKINETR